MHLKTKFQGFGDSTGGTKGDKCKEISQERLCFYQSVSKNAKKSGDAKNRKGAQKWYRDVPIEDAIPEAQEQNAKQLDEVVKKVEEAGVTVDNYTEKQEGLGDLLGNVFSRLGITEEAVEKWAGIGGCGCDKRKKFLNKILPFRKSEPSIAPKKKTQ